MTPDTPDGHGRDGPHEGLRRRYQVNRDAFEENRRRFQEQEDDRLEREDVDRELDRELDRKFIISELAALRADIDQLRAQIRPLVQLTSELLQERYLRRGED